MCLRVDGKSQITREVLCMARYLLCLYGCYYTTSLVHVMDQRQSWAPVLIGRLGYTAGDILIMGLCESFVYYYANVKRMGKMNAYLKYSERHLPLLFITQPLTPSTDTTSAELTTTAAGKHSFTSSVITLHGYYYLFVILLQIFLAYAGFKRLHFTGLGREIPIILLIWQTLAIATVCQISSAFCPSRWNAAT